MKKKNEANKQRGKKSKGKKQEFKKSKRKKQAKCDRGNTGDK